MMQIGKIAKTEWVNDDGQGIKAHVMVLDIYPEEAPTRFFGFVVWSNKAEVYKEYADEYPHLVEPGGLVSSDYE